MGNVRVSGVTASRGGRAPAAYNAGCFSSLGSGRRSARVGVGPKASYSHIVECWIGLQKVCFYNRKDSSLWFYSTVMHRLWAHCGWGSKPAHW